MEGGRGAVPMAAAELRKLQRRWGPEEQEANPRRRRRETDKVRDGESRPREGGWGVSSWGRGGFWKGRAWRSGGRPRFGVHDMWGRVTNRGLKLTWCLSFMAASAAAGIDGDGSTGALTVGSWLWASHLSLKLSRMFSERRILYA